MIYLLANDKNEVALIKAPNLKYLKPLARWAVKDGTRSGWYHWCLNGKWEVKATLPDKLRLFMCGLRHEVIHDALQVEQVTFIDNLAFTTEGARIHQLEIVFRRPDTGAVVERLPSLRKLAERIGVTHRSARQMAINGRLFATPYHDRQCFVTAQ